MIQHRDVTGLFLTQLLQQCNRLREASIHEVLRGVFEPNGEPPSLLEHLIGPWIAPVRITGQADGEGKLRLVDAPKPTIASAEKLHRIAVAGMLSQCALE